MKTNAQLLDLIEEILRTAIAAKEIYSDSFTIEKLKNQIDYFQKEFVNSIDNKHTEEMDAMDEGTASSYQSELEAFADYLTGEELIIDNNLSGERYPEKIISIVGIVLHGDDGIEIQTEIGNFYAIDKNRVRDLISGKKVSISDYIIISLKEIPNTLDEKKKKNTFLYANKEDAKKVVKEYESILKNERVFNGMKESSIQKIQLDEDPNITNDGEEFSSVLIDYKDNDFAMAAMTISELDKLANWSEARTWENELITRYPKERTPK